MLYFDTACDSCGEHKPVVIGGGEILDTRRPEADADFIGFCTECLRKSHPADEVLDMIEARSVKSSLFDEATINQALG